MHIAIVDCGTTNSRVYITSETGSVTARASREVGVRDTARTGTSETLKKGLREAFDDAVESAALGQSDIELVASSGMITSELGLVEVPHLWAPASARELANRIVRIDDHDTFPAQLPVYFVPGIKNRYDPERAGIADADTLDFMRGEETQAVGMLQIHEVLLPTLFTVLSSHTKFVSVDEQGSIQGSLTTLSGQVYGALAASSSIAKSFAAAELAEDDFRVQDYENVIDCACRFCNESGLLRTLLITRFLDTLLRTTPDQRRIFVEAAIASEDIKVLSRMTATGLPENASFVLVGGPRRTRLYEYMLEEKAGIRKTIVTISRSSDVDSLSIAGTITLLRLAGLL